MVLPKTVGDFPRAHTAVSKDVLIIDVEVSCALSVHTTTLPTAPIRIAPIIAVNIIGVVIPLIAILVSRLGDKPLSMVKVSVAANGENIFSNR